MRALFVCSQAKLRSRTAAVCLYGEFDSIAYAGTDSNADIVITREMCDEADIIFCMEQHHRTKIRRKWRGLSHKIVVLGIEDDYCFLDDRLVHLLKLKIGRYLEEK